MHNCRYGLIFQFVCGGQKVLNKNFGYKRPNIEKNMKYLAKLSCRKIKNIQWTESDSCSCPEGQIICNRAMDKTINITFHSLEVGISTCAFGTVSMGFNQKEVYFERNDLAFSHVRAISP